MPLDENRLAKYIGDELSAEFPLGDRDIDPSTREKAARALARAVIKELRSATVIGLCPGGTGGPLANGRIT